MIKASPVEIANSTDIPPGPFHDQNLVLAFLQDGEAGAEIALETLPRGTTTFLRDTYRPARSNPVVMRELLVLARDDIMQMADPQQRLDVRMRVAGIDEDVLPLVTINYKKSEAAFKTAIAERKNAENLLRRGVSKAAGAVATSGVDTIPGISQKPAAHRVRVGSTRRRVAPDEDKTPAPTPPVSLVRITPKLRPIVAKKAPAEVLPEQSEPVSLVRTRPKSKKPALANVAASPEAAPIDAKAGAVATAAVVEPLETGASEQATRKRRKEVTNIRRREGETIEDRSNRQTLSLAQDLFGAAIPAKYAAQFRSFMKDFGLPLYEAIRMINGKRLHTISDRVEEAELYMAGARPIEIREQVASTVPVNKTLEAVIETMQGKYLPQEFVEAFARYCAGGELPTPEAIFGIIPERVIGSVAMQEAVKPQSPKSEPSQEPKVQAPTPSRPASTRTKMVYISRETVLERRGLEDQIDRGDLADIFGLPEEASWQERALCSQTDPEAFFPEKGGSTREAKRICTGCEVRQECLAYALEHDERFGIWGGLSERERRRLKKRAV